MDVLKEYLKVLASLFLAVFGLNRGISVTCIRISFDGIRMSVIKRPRFIPA
jgi:predicted Co/Zn/Cd cation transporter (cation efflux family)